MQVYSLMNKRVIKIICWILALVTMVLTSYFLLSGEPPFGYSTVKGNDIGGGDYLKHINSYVRRLLHDELAYWLPKRIPEDCKAQYDLHYSCGLLTSPNVVIDLRLSFDEETAFEGQRDEAMESAHYELLSDGETDYIILSKIDFLKEFLYGDFLEGPSFYRVIAIKENDKTMEYLYAYINNVNVQPEPVLRIAQVVYDLEQSENS